MSDTFLDPQGRVYTISSELAEDTIPDVYKAVKISLVDTNLFSGSSDRLRTNLGGYFTNTLNEEGQYGTPPPFVRFQPGSPLNENIVNINQFVGENVAVERVLGRGLVEGETTSRALGYGSADDEAGNYGFSQTTVIPSVTFVARIEGNPLAPYMNNVLQSSKYWKTLFTGGSFDHQSIQSIYNQATFDDHYITTNGPYTALEKNFLFKGAGITQVIGVSPQYNRYWREYQEFFSSRDMSERNIPNWYRLQMMGSIFGNLRDRPADFPTVEDANDRALKLFDGSMIKYYTANGAVDSFQALYSIVSPGEEGEVVTIDTPWWSFPDAEHPDVPQLKNLYTYLNATLPNTIPTINPLEMQRMSERNKNIIFNHQGDETSLSDTSEAMESQASLPYYVKIDLPQLPIGLINRKIVSRECSSIIMRTLKETFLGQTDERLTVTNRQFVRNAQFLSSSASRSENLIKTTSEIVSYRTADFVKMILYAYDNVLNELEDYCFMNYQTLEVKAAEDTHALYRSYNSRNTSLLLSDVLGMFGGSAAAVSVSSLDAILNSQISDNFRVDEAGTAITSPIPPASKYHEVLAYRVQKIGGPPRGDEMTQSDIQNFWIFNVDPETTPEQVLMDSQVKYGQEYTYNISAYYLIKGFKYQYKGLQMTRVIGQVREDGYTGPLEFASGIDGGPPQPPVAYCIEYYNPFNEFTVEDYLRNTGDVYGFAADLVISSYSTSAQRAAVSSVYDDAPEGEGTTILPPYVANIVVTCQPSLRVVEIPMLTKTVTVRDNPPNQLDVIPAYTVGNTNQLTFDIFYEPFSPQPYPRAVNQTDVKNALDYIRSHDITAYQNIQQPSRSNQAAVEVYRLATKPSSFKDFDTVMPTYVNLVVDGGDFSYTTCTFNDIVKSNHKYYYLFRSRNANNIAGNVDTVICAELINDGGYKYALFDTLFEEDLIEDPHKESTTQFGKILQLVPPLHQTQVKAHGADFSKPLNQEQYNEVDIGTAEDTIWGKTFKIRLTSKKTGKKIDLNITYNDPDIKLLESEGEEDEE